MTFACKNNHIYLTFKNLKKIKIKDAKIVFNFGKYINNLNARLALKFCLNKVYINLILNLCLKFNAMFLTCYILLKSFVLILY